MKDVKRSVPLLIVCLLASHAGNLQGAFPPPTTRSSPAKLRWAPPTLEKPSTIQLGVDNPVPGLRPDRDYIIKLPNAIRTRATILRGGRNVIIMGGHVALANLDNTAADDAEKRAFYIKDCTGTVHIEGVLIDGAKSGEYDAFAIAAPPATVQLENIRVIDVHGTFKTFHGDIVQPWGGVKELRIDRMTGSTSYQGLQIDQDHGPIGREIIQHVNLTGSGNYKVWLTKNEADKPPSISLREVYVTPPPGRALADSVWPPARDKEAGAVASADGSEVTWPKLPFIQGSIRLGPPPGGDFVPLGLAGLTYQSPGYEAK